MISVVYTPADAVEQEEFPVAMGAQDVPLDWQAVADACEAASRQFGWGADFRIFPERRLVEAVVPADRIDHVARTTLKFYAAVADRIGTEAFMALWVDFDIAHTRVDEQVEADDDFIIPAGGRRMEMDWEQVTAAFQSAVERLGWDAKLEIRPEKQYVMVRFSSGDPEPIAEAMSAFYGHVEDALGVDVFMSIWIDFSFLPSIY